MAVVPIVDSKDRNYAIISAVVLLSLIFIYLFLMTFQMADPEPQAYVMKTETTIDEIVLENLKIEAGGSGGGTPSDAPVGEPKPQTQKVLTKPKNPKTKSNSGESNQTTTPNSMNSPNSAKPSNNPFGTGGTDGKGGIGSGGPFGDDKGTGVKGSGGPGKGEGRIRLNDPQVEDIKPERNETVYLKLSVNSDGNVVSAISTSKTTTTDQRIINQVIAAVKSSVKYSKDPGSELVTMFLTVKVDAK